MAYQAGSAEVSIVPSFKDFHKQVAAELDGMDAQFAKAGDKAGGSFADSFKARTAGLSTTVKADVDDARAKTELDVLARRRSTTLDVDVNGGALSGLSRLLSGASGSGGILGALPSGGVLAGIAAAVPAAEALLVEVTALGSGLAAAGAGAGAFALLAKPAFGAVSDAYTAIGKDQKAYDDALTKTAKNTALAHLKQDWASLDPAERGAVQGLQGLAGEYRKLSSAFEPKAFQVFNQGLKLAGDLLPKVTPFADTFAGSISSLLGRFDQAVKSKGFASFLDQLHAIEGPALMAIGDGIAKVVPAVGKLMTVFSAQDDAKAIGIAFNIVAGALDATAYAVNRLRTNWDGMSSFAKAAVHDTESALGGLAVFSLTSFRSISDVALTSFKTIVHGAADAFGWVPGVGGKLKEADAALGAFKDSADGTFSAAVSSVSGWKTALDNAPKVAKLQGDISDLTAKLGTAKRELADPNLTAARKAAVKGDISDLTAKLANANAQLNAINGKTAHTFVTVTAASSAFGVAAGALGFASGTPSAPAGWAWVGEQGPELVHFAGGEQVLTNRNSVSALGSLASAQSLGALSSLAVPSITSPSLPGVGSPLRGGPLQLQLSYAGSGNALTDALVGALRIDIQQSGGGDVQAHLGRGQVRV